MTMTASVQPLLEEQSYAIGNNKKSNGRNVSAMVIDHSIVFVEVTDIGVGGVLNVRVQDAREDIDARYVDSGDQVLNIIANGIYRIPFEKTRGKYLRLNYDVVNNAIVFEAHMVKREES
jgi:hypothetical protein